MTPTRIICAAALTLVCVMASAPAIARQVTTGIDIHGFNQSAVAQPGILKSVPKRVARVGRHSVDRRDGHGVAQSGRDPRPSRWCGWWLRHHLGVSDRAYNLARKWAGIGTPAHGPAPGVVAVWPHHVGLVTGVPKPGVIVLKSGNDGHAVRERERSTRGIIAYRWPPGVHWAMAQ